MSLVPGDYSSQILSGEITPPNTRLIQDPNDPTRVIEVNADDPRLQNLSDEEAAAVVFGQQQGGEGQVQTQVMPQMNTGPGEMPFVTGIQRDDQMMDPVMQQLLFGLDGQGGFLPGAFRAANRTFFDEEGRPLVIPQAIAGFSPDQIAAQQLARQNLGMQTPFLQRAEGAFGQGIGALQSGLQGQIGQQEQALSALQRAAGQEEAQRGLGLSALLGGAQRSQALAGATRRDLDRALAEQRGFAGQNLGRFEQGLGAVGDFQSQLFDQFGRGVGEFQDIGRRAAGQFERGLQRVGNFRGQLFDQFGRGSVSFRT